MGRWYLDFNIEVANILILLICLLQKTFISAPESTSALIMNLVQSMGVYNIFFMLLKCYRC